MKKLLLALLLLSCTQNSILSMKSSMRERSVPIILDNNVLLEAMQKNHTSQALSLIKRELIDIDQKINFFNAINIPTPVNITCSLAHIAAYRAQWEILDALLEKLITIGTKIENIKDSTGRDLLYYASFISRGYQRRKTQHIIIRAIQKQNLANANDISPAEATPGPEQRVTTITPMFEQIHGRNTPSPLYCANASIGEITNLTEKIEGLCSPRTSASNHPSKLFSSRKQS